MKKLSQKNIPILIVACVCMSLIITCNQPQEKMIQNDVDNLINDSLVSELNWILIDDQEYRSETDIEHIQKQHLNDYYNLIKVEAILNKFGWLGPEIIGKRGSDALFLVIQHADIRTQRKYLPMIRQAVINRKLNGKQWILLEDRVSLANTGKQIYGSQIQMNQVQENISFHL